MGSVGPTALREGLGGARGPRIPLTAALSPWLPAAVEGALARERHCHQNAENTGLDNSEEPRLQRGIPKAAVSANVAPQGSRGSGRQALYEVGRSQAVLRSLVGALRSGAEGREEAPAGRHSGRGAEGVRGCGQHPLFSGLSLLLQDLLSPQRATRAGCLPVPPGTPPRHHQPLDALRLPLQRVT